jgi:hypothetical protein
MAKTPPSLPFCVQDHFTTISALTLEELGAWTKLMAHCWYEGGLTREVAVRLVGEEHYKSLLYLFVDTPGGISLRWIEEARERRKAISAKYAANGRKGGRGNKRKPKAERQAPPRVESHATAPASPKPQPSQPPRAEPARELEWPSWAGERVRAAWEKFKAMRWEEHGKRYNGHTSEQTAINRLAEWFGEGVKKGQRCEEALREATARTWLFPLDPRVVSAQNKAKAKGNAPAPKAGDIPIDKVKECLR